MSNEMKLLHALCEALGFEVETTLYYMPRKEKSATSTALDVDRELAVKNPATGELLIDEEGNYTSLLVTPIVDYKLHKVSDG